MVDFRKFGRSIIFATRGLRWLMAENNARIHLWAAIWAIGLGIFWEITFAEWLWIGLAITLVLVCEAFNTALERLTDLVSPQWHPLAGQVKDLAAAGVLIASAFALLVGLGVLGPYALAWLWL